jgi:hypothetical protein
VNPVSEIEDRKAELLQRIQAAKEKSSEYENLTDEDQLRALEEKLRFEENKARDLPHIREAEEKYGEIRVVNTEMGAIVLRKPNHLNFKNFSRSLNSGKLLDDDVIWKLVRPCIVHPDISRAEEIVEEYPATTIRLGEQAMDLAKGKAAEIEGK